MSIATTWRRASHECCGTPFPPPPASWAMSSLPPWREFMPPLNRRARRCCSTMAGGFADFIHRFEPAAGLPYLPDVARIERAWVEAYHAPDARSLSPAAFARVSAGDLPKLRVALHPSLRVVRSRFPALRIWQANTGGGAPQGVNLLAGGEDALALRSEAEVALRLLPRAARISCRRCAAAAPSSRPPRRRWPQTTASSCPTI